MIGINGASRMSSISGLRVCPSTAMVLPRTDPRHAAITRAAPHSLSVRPDFKSISAINSDTRHLRLDRFKKLHPHRSGLEQQAFCAECTFHEYDLEAAPPWQNRHLLQFDRRDLLSPNRKDWKPAKGPPRKRQHPSIDRHSPQFHYEQPDAKNADGESEPPRRRIPPRDKGSNSDCAQEKRPTTDMNCGYRHVVSSASRLLHSS